MEVKKHRQVKSSLGKSKSSQMGWQSIDEDFQLIDWSSLRPELGGATQPYSSSKDRGSPNRES